MLRLGGKAAIVAACALIGSLELAGVAYAGTPTPSPPDVPAAPSNLHWDNGFGPPGLHWTSHSANEDGFRLQKMTAVGWLTIATYPAGATSGQSPVFSHDDYCDNVQIALVAFNSAGESTPSNAIQLPPLPSGCRSTFHITYTNDSGIVASHLLVPTFGAYSVTLLRNAPGCADPSVAQYSVDLAWPTACVEPGESVVVQFDLISPFYWGDPVWSAEEGTPSPTVSPTIAPSSTPVALPQAGGDPGSGPGSSVILAVGVILILGGSLALKRIR